MIDNFDIIRQYVITLGGFEENDKLNLQIEMLINECLAYCYRSTVPVQMELPLADVIVNEINKRGLLGLDGDVSSYSEGDMSVSYGSNNVSTAKQFYNGKLEPFKQIIGVVKNV